MNKALRQAKKVSVAIVGIVVLLIGVVAIPYPGPGWLIVFAGLAILATEFEWAQRVLDKARGKYDAWTDWIKQQSIYVKAFFVVLTTIIVVTTIWLMNGYGIMNDILNLDWNWLQSPFVR